MTEIKDTDWSRQWHGALSEENHQLADWLQQKGVGKTHRPEPQDCVISVGDNISECSVNTTDHIGVEGHSDGLGGLQDGAKIIRQTRPNLYGSFWAEVRGVNA